MIPPRPPEEHLVIRPVHHRDQLDIVEYVCCKVIRAFTALGSNIPVTAAREDGIVEVGDTLHAEDVVYCSLDVGAAEE